jgi:hypothetical protein
MRLVGGRRTCVAHLSRSLILLLRPSEEEVLISRMLDKVLKRSDVVDKESLCILAGQRVSLDSTF